MKTVLFRALAAVLAVSAGSGAFAQFEKTRLAHATVNDLKTMYWVCDKASTQRALGPAEAAHCSLVYEELKRQAFDGDFERFLAWWRAEKDTR